MSDVGTGCVRDYQYEERRTVAQAASHLILLYWRRLARCSSTSATVTPPPRCTASPGPELAEAVGDTQLQVRIVRYINGVVSADTDDATTI